MLTIHESNYTVTKRPRNGNNNTKTLTKKIQFTEVIKRNYCDGST